MRTLLLASVALLAAPVSAQDHAAHGSDPQPQMDHCAMGHLPPEQCPPIKAPSDDKEIEQSSIGAMEGGDAARPAMDHPTMNHSMTDDGQHGSMIDKSAPHAAPENAVPPRALDGPLHAADAIWGADAMAPSRSQLARENGGMRTGMVMVERLEARIATDGGDDGYLWDAQAFFGGDINRFVLKTEGEGGLGGELEDAEIQALYSRAIGPFFDLQAGLRFDPGPDTRGHLVVGVQGIAPYMFEIDAALFLSDRGHLTARIEGEYDQRITQRLIIQPRVEIELAAQDIPERDVGAGITSIEPGVRLRYEFVREFAPYIGIEYAARLGETASIARAVGEDPDGLQVIIGLRAWF